MSLSSLGYITVVNIRIINSHLGQIQESQTSDPRKSAISRPLSCRVFVGYGTKTGCLRGWLSRMSGPGLVRSIFFCYADLILSPLLRFMFITEWALVFLCWCSSLVSAVRRLVLHLLSVVDTNLFNRLSCPCFWVLISQSLSYIFSKVKLCLRFSMKNSFIVETRMIVGELLRAITIFFRWPAWQGPRTMKLAPILIPRSRFQWLFYIHHVCMLKRSQIWTDFFLNGLDNSLGPITSCLPPFYVG